METNEELKDQEEMINPSDIVFEEEDDADMPTPETDKYEKKDDSDSKVLKPTFKFMKLFEDCLGKMPYSSILKNANNEQIKLIDLMKFVEVKHEQMTVKEMNTIIGFIATCPTEFVRPLMEIVEDSKRQVELWTLVA